jgi:8-oxo-dGTP pyrophosphatase MutT (NUDIX family)
MNYKGIKKCGAIITNKNQTQVLCIMSHETIQKSEFKWGLPKGHKEENESNEKCCIREVREETGIKLRLSGKYHPFIHVFDTRYYLFKFHKKRFYYPRDNYEVSKVRWKNIEDLKNENTNRGLRAIVDSWEEISEIFLTLKSKKRELENDQKYNSYLGV